MELKNIRKCGKEINLIAIGIIQIFVLITLIPSNSYFISQSNNLIENVNIANNKRGGNFLSNLVNLLTGFLTIKQIGFVSAQDGDTFWCCEILESNGATCQPISAEDDSLCDSSGQTWYTDCELTSLCKIGTCIDEEYGTCSPGTKKECGDNWDSENIYDISECQLGCCSLDEGTRKEWWTNLKCNNEGGSFDNNIPQSECRVLTSEMGACVQDDGDCTFTTEENCVTNLNGNPWKGVLCTNPDLGTNCWPTDNTGCRGDKNRKVYFTDNCSNTANIYDSSKAFDGTFDGSINDDYWKFVVNEDSSCQLDLDSRASVKSCGNCGLSSACVSSSKIGISPNQGNFVCKDWRCDSNSDGNKDKQNLESWCIYESHIGNSRDVVGSAHIRKICNEGKIEYDICDVYRGEICADIKANDGSSVARCRINEGIKCLAANEDIEPYEYNEDNELINEGKTFDENNETCVETSPDCRLESIDVDDYFKFNACVPKYPPGFDLIEPPNSKNYKDRCKIASQTCTTVWRKLIRWRCKENCECLTQEFANQMNDLCISLGDCGGYVNIEGEYRDDGFETFDIDELSEKKYNLKHNIDEDNHADGDIKQSKKNEYISYASDTQIGQGELPSYFSGAEKGYFGEADPLEFEIGEVADLNVLSVLLSGAVPAGLAALGLAQIGALTKMVGAIFGTAFPPALIIFVIIEAVIIILVKLFGIGDVKEYDINFECKPWQPPSGGDDCDVCNKIPETCTEYKCESLGAGCELINKDEIYDSEINICTYAFKNDHTDPRIVNHSVSSGYEFVNLPSVADDMVGGIKIEVEGDGCIQEFSQINFSLKTINPENNEDEYAKCAWNWFRVDPDPTDDYKNVPQGEDFKESPYDSIEHTFEGRLPFVSSLNPQEISGNIPGERTGELNMYVRCKDRGENFNFDSYVVNFCIREGPDNEIAIITEFVPEDGSYLAYDETTKPLEISLDKPADCKWSLGEDKSYENMEDFTLCPYNEARPELGGRCTTTLTGLTQSVNNIYIKCKDQPWISEENYTGPWTEEDRNVNTPGFLYTLYATQNPLNITSISPQGTIEIGGTISEIFLEATTTGGMDNGISICKYLFVESPSGITSGDFFSQTGSTVHKQPFSPPTGNYNIAIECKDEAENKATGNAIFNLIKDSEFPKAVRVYKFGSSLKLITDEQASCYYSFNSCNFDFNDENINSMTIAYSTEHTANWNTGQKYYIRCEDLWGNSGCSIIVSLA